jgi:16S rRNA (cytidine1402-2'-O)-methyltransferase
MLEDLSTILNPNTKICVACDITLPTELIITKTASFWKKNLVDLHKKPTIFIIQK